MPLPLPMSSITLKNLLLMPFIYLTYLLSFYFFLTFLFSGTQCLIQHAKNLSSQNYITMKVTFLLTTYASMEQSYSQITSEGYVFFVKPD